MSRILAASALAALIAAAPAYGQSRTVTATGVTKPPGTGGGAPYSRASTEADMLKAQRASAARDKAWDSKMRTTMGSICQGC